jgi:hypothetical protein
MWSLASVANLEAMSLVYTGAAQIRNRVTSRSVYHCSHSMCQPREPCVRVCVRSPFTDATKVMPSAGRSVSQLWVSEPC